jgi:hypothetical protein
MDKKHCSGCHNNFYNLDKRFENGCWHLKSARLIMKKKVPVTQSPPWKQTPQRYPDCYRSPGYVFVDPNVEG